MPTRVEYWTPRKFCIDCTLMLTNGETGQPQEYDDALTERAMTNWDGNPPRFVVDTMIEPDAFSRTPCGSCGTDFAGERYSGGYFEN